MGTDMRAEITAMLNEYRDMRARLESLTADVAALRATARSSDGTVTATVNPHGEMVDLHIDERAVRQVGITPLVPSILEAASRASASVRAQARAVLREFLPEWMHDAVGADGTVDVARILPADPASAVHAGASR